MLGKQSITLDRISFVLLISIAASLPFFQNLTSFLIILLVIISLAKGQIRLQWKRIRQEPLSLGWVALFGLYTVSFLYSEFDVHIIERKMALLALPLVLAGIRLSGKQLKYISLGFAVSTTIASLITFGISVYEAMAVGAGTSLFYQELVDPIGMNAIYMAHYVCFSMVIGFHFGFLRWPSLTPLWQFLLVVQLFWSLIFLTLLSSKVFLVITFLLMNLYFYRIIRKFYKKQWGILQWVANTVLVLLIVLLPVTNERFKNVIQTDFEVITQDSFQYDTDFSGLSLRMVIGRATVDILNNKDAWLLGVGAGDAQEELNKQYSAYKMYTGNPQLGDKGFLGYNAHNQFMQILLEIGLLGLLLWLLLLFYPLYRAVKQKKLLFISFLLMSLIFACTESFLNRHHGIVFFLFFYGILMFSHRSVQKPNTLSI